ncbi:hypothetical protein [Telluribacter sp. SYSU D00476]|uniref:hypothetical protein n=1 Tax=Telluribacter sp. SYSU D00476 TaxID=2811430 RepID=UPI001FF66901|nr:hypothetical protein [Telluribacter sp. SYSU D00476]
MKSTVLTVLLLMPLAATQASTSLTNTSPLSIPLFQQVPADSEASNEKTKKKKKRKLRIRKKVMDTPRSF